MGDAEENPYFKLLKGLLWYVLASEPLAIARRDQIIRVLKRRPSLSLKAALLVANEDLIVKTYLSPTAKGYETGLSLQKAFSAWRSGVGLSANDNISTLGLLLQEWEIHAGELVAKSEKPFDVKVTRVESTRGVEYLPTFETYTALEKHPSRLARALVKDPEGIFEGDLDGGYLQCIDTVDGGITELRKCDYTVEVAGTPTRVSGWGNSTLGFFPRIGDDVTLSRCALTGKDVAFELHRDFRVHKHGSGVVARSANVAEGAYIGRNCRVLGQASVEAGARIKDCSRVEGSAILKSGAILSGFAVVGGNSVVNGVFHNETLAEGSSGLEKPAMSAAATLLASAVSAVLARVHPSAALLTESGRDLALEGLVTQALAQPGEGTEGGP